MRAQRIGSTPNIFSRDGMVNALSSNGRKPRPTLHFGKNATESTENKGHSRTPSQELREIAIQNFDFSDTETISSDDETDSETSSHYQQRKAPSRSAPPRPAILAKSKSERPAMSIKDFDI
eukprot:CAMPEP_0117832288 /NCGR_PEP_ID=MMETSP0949-20121206/9628_1 /TAXON_ID=44440 /ORGANISM="Chattonella subsalsa, Strain CCMP2191" /LENGTH=120 /DNA_ID=CAMNT_0005673713 /DNA_START=32 /DNA_END=394 /DNA_ORIENTATION=+